MVMTGRSIYGDHRPGGDMYSQPGAAAEPADTTFGQHRFGGMLTKPISKPVRKPMDPLSSPGAQVNSVMGMYGGRAARFL
jgi:hypothetical protein